MKVLFVTTSYPSKDNPSYCIFLEQQARSLTEIGVNVEILWLERSTDLVFQKYEQNGLLVYRVGIQWKIIDGIAVNTRTKKILQQINWDNYNVVSLHFGLCTMKNFIIDLCQNHNVPVVAHYHGLNVWHEYFPKRDIIHQMFYAIQFLQTKEILRRVDAVVGVSNRVCREIKIHGNPKRLYTVYNGVDLTLFKRTAPLLVDNVLKILSVGNLIPIKGQRYLIEAFAKLKRKGISAELVLIGDGTDMEELKALCIKHDIGNYVSFLGVQVYDVVAEYMNKSDVFVLPSFYEAFGCVYIEAMSSEMLTCACCDTGADEIITNGETGLLLAQKDVDSIVKALLFAYHNREQARIIAKNGQIKASEFSWITSAMCLKNVYSAIIDC